MGCDGKRSRRFSSSVCVHRLCLLVTVQLICSHTAVNGNFTTAESYNLTATHPSTHRAQRNTTPTPHLVDWKKSTNADDNAATGHSTVSDQTTSEVRLIANKPAAKLVRHAGGSRLVGMAAAFLVGHLAPDQMTSLTSNSPGHVTDPISDESVTITGSTETGNSSRQSDTDDVAKRRVTSRLLRETTVVVGSEGAWESSTSRHETAQYATHDAIGALDQQLITSLDHPSRQHAGAVVDKGQSIL